MTLLLSSSPLLILPAAVVVVLWTTTTPALADAKKLNQPVCDPADAKTCVRQELSSTSSSSCGLYLAESLAHPGQLGMFNGDAEQQSAGARGGGGDQIGSSSEILIPMVDPNKNEWTAWHDFVWDSALIPGLLHENKFLSNVFLAGVGSLTNCADKRRGHRANIRMATTTPTTSGGSNTNVNVDSSGVHRSRDPTAGSFSYYHNLTHESMYPLMAGEELFMNCDGEDDTDDRSGPPSRPTYHRSSFTPMKPTIHNVRHLQKYGLCMDNLAVRTSTVPGAGRGAFAKRSVREGQAVASSPMLHLDRSQTEIVAQAVNNSTVRLPMRPRHEIDFTERVTGRQLLLNYCFGNKDSNVLLFPLAPGVNLINHGNAATAANVRMEWSENSKLPLADNSAFLQLTAHDLFSRPGLVDGSALVVDFVATRDIEEGEEILLDYGDEWQRAWDEHVARWNAAADAAATADEDDDSSNYVSAADYLRLHPKEPIRTLEEQASDPYPENVQTACYYQSNYEDEEEEQDVDYPAAGGQQRQRQQQGAEVSWHPDNFACLRPCHVVDRWQKDSTTAAGGSTTFYYKVLAFPLDHGEQPEYCLVASAEGKTVTNVPSAAVTLVDKPYTTDMHLPGAFRHPIGVPANLFPARWMAKDPKPMGDFIPSPLSAGQMAPIRWSRSGKVVTPWAFRIGLQRRIRDTLLEYCDKMGITELFRHVTYRGNPLPAGTDMNVKVNGYNWFLQRPDDKWRSNLHWLSPGDNESHEHYLQALGVAGLDYELEAIGKHLGMDGLVAFHVTFIAVSHSTKGYMHYDVTNTGGKAYNIIIPLMLADETGPELDLQEGPIPETGGDDDDEDDEVEIPVGRYRYEYEVASMMGDDAFHATSAVDYRNQKQMRMAATVYIADVNRDNLDSIMNEYTQAYPPQDPQLLWSWRGRHWKHDDASVKLPKPSKDHILLQQQQPDTLRQA